jgi:hypothetical protein
MRLSAFTLPLLVMLPIARKDVERPLSAAPEPACVIAQRWVDDHAWMRPSSLDGFYYLPAVYQKAVYRSFDADRRIRLWREHLAKYSGPASRLSVSQKRFIDSVAVNLEQLFSKKDPEPDIQIFAAAAIEKFGYRIARTIFGQLGAEDPELLELAALPNRPVRPFVLARYDGNTPGHEELAALFRPAYGARLGVASMGSCDCHVTSDFCDPITGPHEHCAPDVKCEPDGPGCGWFWLEACDGDCVYG